VDSIDEHTPISLGAACAVLGAVATVCLYIGNWKARQERMHKENKAVVNLALRRTKRAERNIEKIMHKLGIEPEPFEDDLDGGDDGDR
jgi:hypothetical protein